MKHINRWSPDSCGCVIDYSWDDADPPEARAHSFENSVKSCPAHAAHHGKAKHWDVVADENQRKNVTLGLAAEAAGVDLAPDEAKVKAASDVQHFSTEYERVAFEHSLREGLKEVVADFVANYSFSFDAGRVLVVSHPSLSPTQKQTLQASVDARHGHGKVRVV